MAKKKKRYKRPQIPWYVKQAIWRQPCVVCGSRKNVHIDHIIPVSKGGTSDPSNLQALCYLCNGRKSNRLTTDELRARYHSDKGQGK